jgi:phosphoglycolate phosphatase
VTRNGLVIFDIDGTLYPGARATIAAVKQALDELGLPQPDDAEITFLVGKPVGEMHAWLHSRFRGNSANRLAVLVDRYELEFVSTVAKPYPGIVDALAETRRFAREMAICTNGPEPYVERVLNAHGLRRFFDHVRFHHTADDTKTRMVREILERSVARPAVVVGDRVDDVQAAHASGLKAVGVAYGYGSAKELSAADVTVATATELPAVLKPLLSPDQGDHRVW